MLNPVTRVYTHKVIEGGNRWIWTLWSANGDGEATMSAEEQQKQLIQLIKQFIVTHWATSV